jgi:hypothetical protein
MLCPDLPSADAKLLPPELPDLAGLPLEASKVMVWPCRACRRYWGVAHSRSFRIWIMVLMSLFGRPNLSCRAGFKVPDARDVPHVWNKRRLDCKWNQQDKSNCKIIYHLSSYSSLSSGDLASQECH